MGEAGMKIKNKITIKIKNRGERRYKLGRGRIPRLISQEVTEGTERDGEFVCFSLQTPARQEPRPTTFAPYLKAL